MGAIKVIVFNSDKRLAMKEANLVFAHCRRALPDERTLVEDYSDEETMMRVIGKSRADVFILSAMGEDAETGRYLRLAEEIRIRQRDKHILFIVGQPSVFCRIINQLLFPAFVFENEVTLPQIQEYFTLREQKRLQLNILAFTSENQKQMVHMQSIIMAKAENKRVILRTTDRQYPTGLTISALEECLPKNFIRIDKGVLVNGDFIRKVDPESQTVILLSGETLVISRRGRQRLSEALKL